MLNKSKGIRPQLRKLADLLADEAEKNPEFANALAEVFGIELVKPTQEKATKIQISDPFEEYISKGQDGFRAWLDQLNIQELRAIVRQQRFDPTRLSDKWKTKERFIALITERVDSRNKQGDTFRFYGKDSDVTESSNPRNNSGN